MQEIQKTPYFAEFLCVKGDYIQILQFTPTKIEQEYVNSLRPIVTKMQEVFNKAKSVLKKLENSTIALNKKIDQKIKKTNSNTLKAMNTAKADCLSAHKDIHQEFLLAVAHIGFKFDSKCEEIGYLDKSGEGLPSYLPFSFYEGQMPLELSCAIEGIRHTVSVEKLENSKEVTELKKRSNIAYSKANNLVRAHEKRVNFYYEFFNQDVHNLPCTGYRFMEKCMNVISNILLQEKKFNEKLKNKNKINSNSSLCDWSNNIKIRDELKLSVFCAFQRGLDFILKYISLGSSQIKDDKERIAKEKTSFQFGILPGDSEKSKEEVKNLMSLGNQHCKEYWGKIRVRA